MTVQEKERIAIENAKISDKNAKTVQEHKEIQNYWLMWGVM